MAQVIMSLDDQNAILGEENQAVTMPKDFNSSISMIQKIMTMEACMVQSSINNDKSSSDSDISVQPAILFTKI